MSAAGQAALPRAYESWKAFDLDARRSLLDQTSMEIADVRVSQTRVSSLPHTPLVLMRIPSHHGRGAGNICGDTEGSG
jgi:hypothetical protein